MAASPGLPSVSEDGETKGSDSGVDVGAGSSAASRRGSMPFAPPSMKRASSANSRRICESLVLDSPKELLSKTPKQIAEAAAMLRKGDTMLKFCRKSKPKTRFVRVTEELDGISWESRRKNALIPFYSIVRVQKGPHTSTFARGKFAATAIPERSFSIICDPHITNGRVSLDLVAGSIEQRNLWVEGLQLLLYHQRAGVADSDLKVLMRSFKQAPKQKSNRMTYDQVKSLLRSLNIYVSKAILKPKFNQLCAPDTDMTLAFDGVVKLVDDIRDRADVTRVFKLLLKYQSCQEEDDEPAVVAVTVAGDGAVDGSAAPAVVGGLSSTAVLKGASTKGHAAPRGDALTAATVLHFMKEIQREEDATIEDALSIIAHFQLDGPAVAAEKEPALMLSGFIAYLTSTANSAFAPELTERYQDMSQPLTSYYIDSSHNTYLEGDQFSSSSSVNMYINVLTRGCRCVELDCWDGPDGEPVIYHGHTLTTRILFTDVVKAIRDFGFKTSPYPLILSLEVHCSIPQQDRMAAILRHELGDMLQLPDGRTNEPLPSPAELVHKVLVKAYTVESQSFGVGDAPTTPVRPGDFFGDSSPVPTASDADGTITVDVDGGGPADTASTVTARTLAPAPVPLPEPVAAGAGLEGSRDVGPVTPAPALAVAADADAGANGVVASVAKAAVAAPSAVPATVTSVAAAVSAALAPTTVGTVASAVLSRHTGDGVAAGVGGDDPPRTISTAAASRTRPPAASNGDDGGDATRVSPVPRTGTTPREQSRSLASYAAGDTVVDGVTEAVVVDLLCGPRPSRTNSINASPKPKSTASVKKLRPVAQSLSDLVFIQAVKFDGFEQLMKYGTPRVMTSIKEPKAEKSIYKHPKAFMECCMTRLMRVYPGPLRVDSSNFNPSLCWAVGCQMVALNFQTPGVPTQLNQARFRQNGRCGYVLKPNSFSTWNYKQLKSMRKPPVKPSSSASPLQQQLSKNARKQPIALPALLSSSVAPAVGVAVVDAASASGRDATVSGADVVAALDDGGTSPPPSLVVVGSVSGSEAATPLTVAQSSADTAALEASAHATPLGPTSATPPMPVASPAPVPPALEASAVSASTPLDVHVGEAVVVPRPAVTAAPLPPPPVQALAAGDASCGASPASVRSSGPDSVAVDARLNDSVGVSAGTSPSAGSIATGASVGGGSLHAGASAGTPRARVLDGSRLGDGNDVSDSSDGQGDDSGDCDSTTGSVASSTKSSGKSIDDSRWSGGYKLSSDGVTKKKKKNKVKKNKTADAVLAFAGVDGSAGDQALTEALGGSVGGDESGKIVSGGVMSTSLESVFTHTLLAHIRSTLVCPRFPESVLVVELMGGQYLPTLDHGKGGVVSPYCVVSVHGHPVDKLRQRSRVVVNNGLNPVWGQTFEFKIEHPDLAMLHIGVYHQTDIGRDTMLAHFAAPIPVLRVGYRSCPLRNKFGKRIPFCNLLCMFATKPCSSSPQAM